MNTVTLTKNGTLLHKGEAVASSPLRYLNYQAEPEKEFTLRSFFLMCERYPMLAELNEFFPALREHYRSCPESDCTWSEIDYLEFAKTVEMIGFPSEPRLEIYNALKGIQGGKIVEIRPLLLESLLDIPVRLGKLKHVVFGDKMDVFEFDTVFNLFEFVDGISWELSFQSTSNLCGIRR